MLDGEGEFRQVYEAFRPRVLRHLTSLVGEDEAEDVAQDVFLKIYAALPYFRGESQLSTWIHRIVSNAALDRIRKASRRRLAEGRLPGEVMAEEEDQRLWVTSEEQGLKDAEVARLLGLTPGVVKIRLHRARAKLRAQLEANCTFDRDDCNRLTCEPKVG